MSPKKYITDYNRSMTKKTFVKWKIFQFLSNMKRSSPLVLMFLSLSLITMAMALNDDNDHRSFTIKFDKESTISKNRNDNGEKIENSSATAAFPIKIISFKVKRPPTPPPYVSGSNSNDLIKIKIINHESRYMKRLTYQMIQWIMRQRRRQQQQQQQQRNDYRMQPKLKISNVNINRIYPSSSSPPPPPPRKNDCPNCRYRRQNVNQNSGCGDGYGDCKKQKPQYQLSGCGDGYGDCKKQKPQYQLSGCGDGFGDCKKQKPQYQISGCGDGFGDCKKQKPQYQIPDDDYIENLNFD
ncbi:uncharacterized protein LOC124491286 isoform X1 [Dermatophagoides farinae]|uniref:uncharacterized protein LOC124491286 isoform X1 n=1 Tax=Dermatophagoides farinae TaxID=6954 RepID=UPI003F614CB1